MLKSIFVGVGILLLGVSPVRAAEDSAGMVREISGTEDIQIINAAHGGSRRAKTQDLLYEGDKIITLDGQSVVLELAEHSQIVIAPLSSFTIETYRGGDEQQSIFQIFYGNLRAIVRKAYKDKETFAIKTPNAVMGVRGTEFDVAVSRTSGITQVHTLQGTVALGSSMAQLREAGGMNLVFVKAGLSSAMKKGEIRPVAPAPFNVETYRKKALRTFPVITSRNGISDGMKHEGGPEVRLQKSDKKHDGIQELDITDRDSNAATAGSSFKARFKNKRHLRGRKADKFFLSDKARIIFRDRDPIIPLTSQPTGGTTTGTTPGTGTGTAPGTDPTETPTSIAKPGPRPGTAPVAPSIPQIIDRTTGQGPMSRPAPRPPTGTTRINPPTAQPVQILPKIRPIAPSQITPTTGGVAR